VLCPTGLSAERPSSSAQGGISQALAHSGRAAVPAAGPRAAMAVGRVGQRLLLVAERPQPGADRSPG